MDMEKDYEFTDYGYTGEESPVEESPAEESALGFTEEIVAEEGVKTFWDKIKEIPKAVWVAAAAAVAVIIAIIIIASLMGNTYKTPIKALEKLLNCKRASQYVDLTLAQMNGFAEDEINEVYEILMKSEDFEEQMEENESEFEDGIEDRKDEYGSNYKYSFEIVDKVELEKEDLKEFRDGLRIIGDSVEEIVENTDDYDSDDWEDAAEDMGLSRSQAKKLFAALEKVGKKFDSAKVSAGYEVSGVMKITGSELDEPEEFEITFVVLKIDGRWVSEEGLEEVFRTLSSVGSFSPSIAGTWMSGTRRLVFSKDGAFSIDASYGTYTISEDKTLVIQYGEYSSQNGREEFTWSTNAKDMRGDYWYISGDKLYIAGIEYTKQ